MLLGLDVSTSITGATVINSDGELVFCEAWRTDKKDLSFFDKLERIKKSIEGIKKLYKIKQVYIEEPLMGFKSGFSSAQTIAKLLRFNGAVSWICKETFRREPIHIRASSARKHCGIKVEKGKKAKDVVLNFLLDSEPSFEISYTKYGNPAKGSYDMADSIVIARAGFKLWKEKNSNYSQTY